MCSYFPLKESLRLSTELLDRDAGYLGKNISVIHESLHLYLSVFRTPGDPQPSRLVNLSLRAPAQMG
jgi:hypothetical protein